MYGNFVFLTLGLRLEARRKEREERDNMVRNYIRNGRGWSEPGGGGGNERSRKLPKTPANSLNAMGVLQSMLGLSAQTPFGSITTLNGSMPSKFFFQAVKPTYNLLCSVLYVQRERWQCLLH